MTTFDRFDPFERRISEAIDEIAAARRPDYLDDVFRRTARTAQRPRWTFPERWLPMDTVLSRPGIFGRIPLRQLVVLGLLMALVAATVALYVGAQRRVPPPFGPAANGSIAYAARDDIYVRDTLTGEERVLIGGPGVQFAPAFSPDGTRIAYVQNGLGNGDHFFIADADGSNARDIATIPPTGNAQANWSPDSTQMALIYDVDGIPRLSIVSADGSPTTVLDLGERVPLDLAWSAPIGERLVIRTLTGVSVQLLTMRPDGTELQVFDLRGASRWGTEFTLSGETYSPDGSTIAYNGVDVVETPGGLLDQFRVHLINPDGSGDRAVPGPSDGSIQENWPAYSPDGRWILVHRWHLIGDVPDPQGWLAVMPADGSSAARDIGPRIAGGQETGLTKLWSPDGSRVLMRSANTRQVFSIDPFTGTYEALPWTAELPDWQRVVR